MKSPFQASIDARQTAIRNLNRSIDALERDGQVKHCLALRILRRNVRTLTEEVRDTERFIVNFRKSVREAAAAMRAKVKP